MPRFCSSVTMRLTRVSISCNREARSARSRRTHHQGSLGEAIHFLKEGIVRTAAKAGVLLVDSSQGQQFRRLKMLGVLGFLSPSAHVLRDFAPCG